ncbi:MAG: bifunctional transaldolase/phosoglucose isomerase [Desulfobacterales bacterium]|nr:bifunctional transaldolase/phosoglucose isomerase [Desulfobacterales bacterium]MDD4393150.1 bifunctional transaldolase/phosoglucose isomerase [Desulfobacterales bacterium]
MTKLNELAALGQSVWVDYIRRSFITSGELTSLIDQGLCGLTSNPAIFEKAIAGSADYDEDIRELARTPKKAEEIYEILALKDIKMAADLFLPVFEKTGGMDGYVSIEVSPALAFDTVKTVSEARRLFSMLHRPNIMIKVPATAEGIAAITHLIGSGVNVNVTLLFSVNNYKAVADAYMKGLEMLAAEGPTVSGGRRVDQVASVASFFVSRVDTAVDMELEAVGNKDLQGKIAIANARVAYAEFRALFSGPRWDHLRQKGARVQRLLWGSTGTKNPLYPDTLYVDELIGPDTVNTIAPATLFNFLDHGSVSETLIRGRDDARRQLKQLEQLGIDLDAVTGRLQKEGVELFARPFNAMIDSIREKHRRLRKGEKSYMAWLGKDQIAVDQALSAIRDTFLVNRIWTRDATVWKGNPDAIKNRLGWLNRPAVMPSAISGITRFVREVLDDGFTHVLLLGMGGSSLASGMFRAIFGVKKGFLDLVVLDSTDPGAVLASEHRIDPDKTLFIVSSKSGGTVETLSLMNYFYTRLAESVGEKAAGKQFVAITDPGSGLEKSAAELHFRKIFLNDPNIGGRYSALSLSGLVPAALIGMDLDRLLDRAATMAGNCEGCNCPVGGDNMGAWMGAVMGTLAGSGRDKLTLIFSPSIMPFGDWVEHLIAESSGKEGKGILPVNREAVAPADTYSRDRWFVYMRMDKDAGFDPEVKELVRFGHPVIQLNLKDIYDIGGEIFRWEMAIAVAGSLLGINPFNQPNAESARVLTRQMVDDYKAKGKLPEISLTVQENSVRVYADVWAETLSEAVDRFMFGSDAGKDDIAGRSYIAIQAFFTPTPEIDWALQDFRTRLQLKYRMATTVGYGPRFLHTTGQLHKGDGGHGMFIQLTSDMPDDLPVPDTPGKTYSLISFGMLKMAQALGDRQALLDAGRRVIRFHLGKDVVNGLKALEKAMG